MKAYQMNVATALDEKYIPYTYVMLFSLFDTNPDAEITTYLLTRGLSEAGQKQLCSLAEEFGNQVVFIEMETDWIPEKALQGRWGVEAFFRLRLFELLPEMIDRLLYLDGDVIVQHSIRELYLMDFAGKDLIACPDMGVPETLERLISERHQKIAPILKSGVYFNSGMILFDVEKLRQTHPASVYLKAAEELSYQICTPDQDLLNYVHYGKVRLADAEQYNFQTSVLHSRGRYLETAKSQAAIIHFTGVKPWDGDNAHYDTDWLWWEVCLRPPFAESLLEEYVKSSILGGEITEMLGQLVDENIQLKQNLEQTLAAFQRIRELTGL